MIELFRKDGKRYALADGVPYPLTVTAARYGGAYEGGRYLAWPAWPEDVPPASHGDDTACSDYFDSHDGPLGRGPTPGDAALDLARQVEGLPRWEG